MRALLPCIVWLSLLLTGGAARALEEADRQAIQRTIERQIEAFRRDDAPGAYAFAAPSIQRMFPDDQGFLAMVRQGYKPVYRQRSLSFGETRDAPDGPLQAVRLQDEDGVDWLAIYSLERQPDGSWRIAGCVLVREPGQPA